MMKNKWKNIFFLLLIWCSFFLAGSLPVLAQELQVKKTVLDNGLTVVFTRMPESPMAAVYALVETGSAREGEWLGSGLSHFLEHMFFKGTEKRGVGEISTAIQSVGGTLNASTGFDYTFYTFSVPKEHFLVGLDVLSDMLMNARIDQQEVQREREVILNEMRLHDDNPGRYLNELVFSQVYQKHPYRHPVIGHPALLKNVTRGDLWRYYKTHYVPNNMILSIAGDLEWEDVLREAKKAFSDFRRAPDLQEPVVQEPRQVTYRYHKEGYPTDITRMSLAFKGVGLTDPDMFALDVLAQILGRGPASRLYRDIYKKRQLVYSISAYNFTPADKGIFWISTRLEAEHQQEVEALIWQHLHDLQQNGIDEHELERAKKNVLRDYIFGYQTSSQAASRQAFGEAFWGDPEFSKKYVELVKQITSADIRRVARQYFDQQQLTTVVLKPRVKAAPEEKADSADQVEAKVEKYRLENGITVLLKEGLQYPLVAANIVLRGGLLEESPANNGIFNLMAILWTQGTKGRTAQEIADFKEANAIKLSGFSGKNSFGLSMSCLAEDIEKAFDLMAEVALEPSFPEDEFELALRDQKKALEMRKEQIIDYARYHLRQELFSGHPYGMDQRGREESLNQLTAGQVREIHQKYLRPENMVLSISGDFDSAALKKQIQAAFGSLQPQKIEFKQPAVKAPDKPVQSVLRLDKQQALVLTGFQGVDLFDSDRYPLTVLDALLGSSFEGRLFYKIREKHGLAYSVGGYFMPGLDKGPFALYALTSRKDAENVEQMIEKQIRDIQAGNISIDELALAKEYLKGTFLAGLETAGSLNLKMALDERYGLGFGYYRKYTDRIDAVTKQQVAKAARKYLDLNKRVTVIIMPKNNKQLQ